MTQNEIELMRSINRSQQEITVHGRSGTNTNEIAQGSYRDQTQQQSQVDLLRRQLQSLMQKEKTYKYEITDLKQRLGHR